VHHQDFVWYFAYGSNMDLTRLYDARLKPEGVAIIERRLGRLASWRLCFNKKWHRFSGGGAANIVQDHESHVFGTLNLMPPKGLDILDHYEGVAAQQYQRRHVMVELCDEGRLVEAVAYIGYKDLDPHLVPPRFYLDHLLAGRDLLPVDYAAWLAAHPTLPIDREV
jgi:gamma-glutamylcyclotransferase